MAATATAPASAGERIGAVAAKLDAAREARKTYRLRVVAHAKDGRPAPFYGVTIAGVNFAEMTAKGIPDPRNPGRDKKVDVEGQIVSMTPTQHAKLKAGMDRYIVRWTNRTKGIASVIDSDLLDGRNPEAALNPESDEPIAPWLSVEELD